MSFPFSAMALSNPVLDLRFWRFEVWSAVSFKLSRGLLGFGCLLCEPFLNQMQMWTILELKKEGLDKMLV